MIDEPLMSIGLFARSSLLSVKALRAYHERGLLVPASIDPQTGYRAYHPGQLVDAVAIRRLRDLDVPLDVVKQILDARDPEVTAKLLGEHESAMRDRLADTARIVGELQAMGDHASAPAVHVRPAAHLDAIAITGTVAVRDYPVFLSDAYPRLGAALAGGGLTPAGPPMALYDLEVGDGDHHRVTACLPVTAPTPDHALVDVELIELPAVTVAVVVHEGGYDTIGDAYASLGAWVAYHARSMGASVREVYAVGPVDIPDPADFRTEIHWPIEATNQER